MFDPYHKWLGIPPAEQPPDHYRLLGLARFEADREVIDAAANRQMAYLQGCATGERVTLSQRLLNEVAAARLALLTPARKAIYDAQLRSQLAAPGLPVALDPAVAVRAVPGAAESRHRDCAPAPAPIEDEHPAADPQVREVFGPDDRSTRPAIGRHNMRIIVATSLIPIGLGLFVLFRDRLRAPLAAPEPIAATRRAEAAVPRPASPVEPPTIPASLPQVAPAVAKVDPIPPEATVTQLPPPAVAQWTPPQMPRYPERYFRELFYGRVLDGPLVNMSNCWMEEKFDDFALRFQYRLNEGAHLWDGVRLRHGGADRLSLVLAPGACGGLLLHKPITGLRPPLADRAIEDGHHVAWPARNANGPAGGWNDCEVVCKGSHVVVAINGVVVNEIHDAPTGVGMICVAGEDKDVAFRQLRVLGLDGGIDPDLRATAGPRDPDKPAILRWAAKDWEGSPHDSARHGNGAVRLDMGGGNWGYGEAGFEATGYMRVDVKLGIKGVLGYKGVNSAAGFVIDYHTPGGYTWRHFCELWLGNDHPGQRIALNPDWGKRRPFDHRERIGLTSIRSSTIELDLKRWAPPDWDGRFWFTALLQITGEGTAMTAKLTPIE